jgi:ADP-ribose pyrophosphatase
MAKIPSGATKVFEGIIFDVYHFQQEQFDGSFKTFEMLKHRDSVVIAPIVGDKIYLQHEEQPNEAAFLGLPAGRFDKGETDPIAVAKRELLEETGYTTDDFQLLRSIEVSGTIEWTQHIVVARNCRKVSEPHLDAGGEKIHETMLVSFGEFLELSKRADFRRGALTDDITKSLYDPAYKESFRKQLFGL